MKIGEQEFDDEFMRENMMGPNAVRILEEMTRDLEIRQDARILDLGCGKGLTSIYLARKYGAIIYATDLWISATENYQRFKQMGLEDRIIPIHADVHDLPYADGFFDIIISVDSFHYYGFEEGFLDEKLAPLLKKGGRILVTAPGLQKEFDDGVPEELKPFFKLEYHFHTCDWWKDLWSRSEMVEEIHCNSIVCHKQAWKDWLISDNEYAIQDRPMMEAEGGNYYNTVFFEARRK